MVSFQKAFWSKLAVAGHGTRYLFRLTFSLIISIFAILLSQCFFAKRIEKNSNNSDDSLPINCLSSANQQCVQPVSVTVFFFSLQIISESKLSEVVHFRNIPKKPLRAQEVNSFPQWSGEGQKSVTSMSSNICNHCTCATGCQKFSDVRLRLLPGPLVSWPRDQETTGSGDENVNSLYSGHCGTLCSVLISENP